MSLVCQSLFIDDSDRLGDTFTCVPGRFLGNSAFYIEVEASQYIVDIVSSWYELIFKNNQPLQRKKNGESFLVRPLV